MVNFRLPFAMLLPKVNCRTCLWVSNFESFCYALLVNVRSELTVCMSICIVVYSQRFPSSQQLKLHALCMYVVVQLCPSVRVALLASRDITVVVVAERKKISRALGFDKMALLKEDFFASKYYYVQMFVPRLLL